MVIDNKGPLVGYAFYELLEAENARLKAEVKRLRKVGDAMASALILFEMKSEEERQDRIKAWSAAKEGKQP